MSIIKKFGKWMLEGIWFCNVECELIGGLDIKPYHKTKVQVFKNKIDIYGGFMEKQTIEKDDIIDCSIKTQEQINKSVTFKRLLAIGVFAFAFKKTTHDNVNYCVVTYRKDGLDDIECQAIFKGKDAPVIVNSIYKMKASA